jgi:hypothetical protein
LVITFPSDTREIINAIRSGIGRNVTFYEKVSEPCSGCTINPVTNTSTNSFCVSCNGEGYIYTYSGYPILAHITWGKVDNLNWQTGGQLFEGECRIQIEYIPENVTIINKTSYLNVDGKKMTIDTKDFRGVPNINRIVLNLEEMEREA